MSPAFNILMVQTLLFERLFFIFFEENLIYIIRNEQWGNNE